MRTNTPTILWTLVLTAALLLSSGCGSARRSAPLVGEHTLDDPVLAQGRRAFDARCHQCHPGGAAGLGFALNNKPFPGFYIRTQVRLGVGAMPAFSDDEISDDDLDAIVAYMKWLRHLDGENADDA